ncbi:hypothetical protein [Pseudoalteromonas sp. S16_S37]|uniref:hypothetical protein n=1 Tax=Pseudoalteromonas sp. S16_S37 TaxID=2720228 RepID=UPI001680ABF2|nr:hypothetical protein [Pseudoalteromonas sp. S16_S37]MBD1580973.1 hypothetical protein [Pseudoalteromonas sp. S16_S37]
MVEQLKEYKLLLGILLLLALLKFAIVPIVSWQQEHVDAIAQIQKRLSKAQQVTAQMEQIDVASQRVSAFQSEYENLFFDWEDSSKFRINTQKMVNQWLADNELATINIGWQPALKFESAALHREQMRLNISGNVNKLGEFLTQLESHKPIVAIEYFDMGISELTVEQSGTAQVSLLLSFYMQEEATSE